MFAERQYFSIDPGSPFLVMIPVYFYCLGEKFFLLLFIFFPVEENEPKEDARVPLFPARRRCGRSARKLAIAQTVRALCSVRHVDARRGPKGI
jgi:hypothetical protein